MIRRLYYFTSQHYALESIRLKRVKIARFKELNDPFDFVGLAVDLPSQRYYMNRIWDQIDSEIGIICMSTTWQEPLLWGHYADKHKGICLGFDVEAKDWHKVKYRKERPSLARYGAKTLSDITDERWAEISLTKFKAWEYEREYRHLVDLKDPDSNGLHFHPFSERMVLRQLIVGFRSTATRAMVQELVGDDVEAFQARPAFKGFSIVKQHRPELWQ